MARRFYWPRLFPDPANPQRAKLETLEPSRKLTTEVISTNRLIRSARALRMKPVEPSRAWGALQGEIVSPGGGTWEDGGRSPPGWGRVRERHRPAFKGISEAGQHSVVV